MFVRMLTRRVPSDCDWHGAKDSGGGAEARGSPRNQCHGNCRCCGGRRALTDEVAGRIRWWKRRNPATWEQALAMVRRGGVVNFFSGLPTGTRVDIEPGRLITRR